MKKLNGLKERTIDDDIEYHLERARLESDPGEILDELEVVQAYEEVKSYRVERKHEVLDRIVKVVGGVGKIAFIGALTIIGYAFETDNINTRKGIAPAIRNTMNDIGLFRK